jgi:hypothetical protein
MIYFSLSIEHNTFIDRNIVDLLHLDEYLYPIILFPIVNIIYLLVSFKNTFTKLKTSFKILFLIFYFNIISLSALMFISNHILSDILFSANLVFNAVFDIMLMYHITQQKGRYLND